jgi:hypothetical protein
MAAYVELFMDQGATFNNVINLSDDLTNANINISGYIVRSQMRRSYYSANASANLTCQITDASTGKITLSLEPNETANIKAGRYLFDVEITTPANTAVRLIEGIITVTPRVTK